MTTSRTEACVRVAALNPNIGVIDEIIISPKPANGTVNNLVAGQGGVDFPETVLRPTITIIFNRLGDIFFVQIPPESLSNADRIKVDFFNINDELIKSVTSTGNVPQLPNNLEVYKVLKIVVQILRTKDGLSPKKVALDIIGCFYPSKYSFCLPKYAYTLVIVSITVTRPTTTPASTYTTVQPCKIVDGMADVNIIPNEYILNSKNKPIGNEIRSNSNSSGYTPSPSNEKITVKLSADNSLIAIGQIIIRATNFQSVALSIKTLTVTDWKFYSTLTSDITIFDSLYATELLFQFVSNSNSKKVEDAKIGVIGCFPSTGNKKYSSLKQMVIVIF